MGVTWVSHVWPIRGRGCGGVDGGSPLLVQGGCSGYVRMAAAPELSPGGWGTRSAPRGGHSMHVAAAPSERRWACLAMDRFSCQHPGSCWGCTSTCAMWATSLSEHSIEPMSTHPTCTAGAALCR
eukprot:545758-Prymnesium_polylepis.1